MYGRVCKSCGSMRLKSVNESTEVCKKCGYENKFNTVVIDKKLTEEQRAELVERAKNEPDLEIVVKEKSEVKNRRLIAMLLCCFFGILGVHKLYEHKYGMFLLYLCTMSLMFIGWIVDIYRYIYLLTRDRKQAETYNAELYMEIENLHGQLNGEKTTKEVIHESKNL